MPSLYEAVRESLLKLGPANPILRSAIRLQARASGFKVAASQQMPTRAIERSIAACFFRLSHYPVVPSVVHMWDLLFDTVVPEIQGASMRFSISQSQGSTSTRRAVSPCGLPEWSKKTPWMPTPAAYQPQPGDVVWDIGAHAGATSYFFAQMVGPFGKVYAFEPDEHSHTICSAI